MAGQARDLSAITNRGATRTWSTDSTANKLDVITLPSWCKYVSLWFTTNAGKISDTGAADDTIDSTQQAPIPANSWHSFPVYGGLVRVTSATGSTSYSIILDERGDS